MTRAQWMIKLDSGHYQVELDHGLIMGERKVRVNGEEKFRARKLIDFGSSHRFEVGGCMATLTIKTASFPFLQYNLFLNGKSCGSVTLRVPLWFWLFTIPYLLTYIDTVTHGMGAASLRAMVQNDAVLHGTVRGGIAGGLLGIGFAVCAAVALSKGLGERTRMLLCAVITMITGTITLLLLNGLMLG